MAMSLVTYLPKLLTSTVSKTKRVENVLQSHFICLLILGPFPLGLRQAKIFLYKQQGQNRYYCAIQLELQLLYNLAGQSVSVARHPWVTSMHTWYCQRCLNIDCVLFNGVNIDCHESLRVTCDQLLITAESQWSLGIARNACSHSVEKT